MPVRWGSSSLSHWASKAAFTWGIPLDAGQNRHFVSSSKQKDSMRLLIVRLRTGGGDQFEIGAQGSTGTGIVICLRCLNQNPSRYRDAGVGESAVDGVPGGHGDIGRTKI